MTATKEHAGAEGSERYWVEKTAKEYRERGFDVSTEARLDFLPQFRADIVACKGDDKRVVEVKRRTTLRTDALLTQLARAVESQPGWSLDLVLIPEPLQLAAPDGSRPLEADLAMYRLTAAEDLLDAGFLESSLLAAWSACEALVRRQLQLDTGIDDEVLPTSQLVDSATMHGVIARSDSNYLKKLMPVRNAVAHGMSHPEVKRDAVLRLIEFTRAVAADDDRRLAVAEASS